MLDIYKMTYQISPIYLTGGAAGNIPGGMLPLMSITNADAFGADLFGSGSDFDIENPFATWQVMPGGSLVEQSIAQYPFANLSVAANAIIRQPLNLSMVMITPMNTPNAWAVKLATMMALKSTLDAHNNAGGTYTIVTPAMVYTDMLMVSVIDVAMGSSPLPQNAWQFNFTKPLVSFADAAAMSNLMSQITSGLPNNATTTDPGSTLTTAWPCLCPYWP